ncbi:metallophosphoesterase [Thomasclavelia cocleata]|uniref:3',5'-cyclic AMP phosphodiesterase CpdA n=1 Tax=Thomasclavelia cocleata TaxID=69824 RepID=A0A1I0CHR8_9FIRM|nr:metallophosphoesterase [Thomasclavelia cocleata]MCR1959399.1 metallophosphoesterase [Thomasclavelia cocleata]NDO42423.1 metallophosphoesterase [Thomasclavelia cocleata]PJN81059.1 metallophosphoesterase [Thomasclavelia cocleata]SET18682.1 3',5'-cyclic AMP phosphodiesterase CpdA [Thomasclavelia cocleata]
MNEYDLINCYLNLIFDDSITYFNRILDGYHGLCQFKEWMRKRNINLNAIENIDYDTFMAISKAKRIDQITERIDPRHLQELIDYINIERDKYQIVVLSSFDYNESINIYLTSKQIIKDFSNDKVSIINCHSLLEKDDLTFYGPFKHFVSALYQIDRWPGLLIFKGEDCSFVPVYTIKDIQEVMFKINHDTVFSSKYLSPYDSYFVQLSDLHLGSKRKNQGRLALEESLDETCKQLRSYYQLKFLITGDLMNSPNRKNMYEASGFMKLLKNKYSGDVSFILGNHDVIVNGFNVFKRQKSKVIAFLLNESIKVFEEEKIILIKIDSTVEGNLARGKVGQKQLSDIDEELENIPNLQEYTLVAMLHHHLFRITRDEFLKQRWREKVFVGKIMDSSKALVDSQELVWWLRKHQIQYVLHGHKHLPFFNNHDGMYVIAAGSSCGSGAKESDSRYLSYNVLKYSHRYKCFKYCFIVYDDMTLQDRQRIIVNMF